MDSRHLLKMGIHHYLVVGILVFFSIAANSTQANEDLLLLQLSGDEELISIATGTPRSISSAPAVTTVITEEDIRASGALHLEELLEQVPGLHVVISHAKVQSPTYGIRGINTTQGPHTLILVNGKDITYLLTGALPSGFQVPLEAVKRIEIIRGPGSAIYGADAYSGVINIITKDADDINATRVGAKVGSFDTRHIWAQYGGKLSDKNENAWKLAATFEYAKSDGDSGRIINSDLQTILDGNFATSASHAPGPMSTWYEAFLSSFTLSKGRWTSHFNSWNRKLGTGTGFANVLDPNGYTEHDQYLLDINYENKNWLPDWSLSSFISYYYLDSDALINIFPAGSLLPIGSDGNFDPDNPAGLVLFTDGYIGLPSTRENAIRFEVTTLYRGWQDQLWRINVGLKREESKSSALQNFGPGVIDGTTSPIDGTLTDVTGTPYIFIPDSERTIRYVSIQNEWDFTPDWLLTAGIRYDDYSDFGDTTNPRLSLVWQTRYDLTTKLLYGKSFRAPSFGELYAQNNPGITGNPNLEPETISSYELVFDFRATDRLNAILNLFHYDAIGIIEYIDDDGAPGGSSTAQNARDQSADGFEIVVDWQANRKMNIQLSYAQHNAHNEITGAAIADAPKRLVNFKASWRFLPGWVTNLEAYRVMDRPRDTEDSRSPVDDYNWVNANIRAKELFNNWEFSFVVQNLFDTDAREPGPTEITNDYPLEGRSVYLYVSTKL